MKKLTLGEWTIEPEVNMMSHQGEEIQLEPLTMKMLVFMADRQGQVVTRQMLMDHLWGDVVVSNDSLNRIASQLRKLFQQDEDTDLETVRGVGYRLTYRESQPQKVNHTNQTDKRKFIAGIFLVLMALVIILRLTQQEKTAAITTPELRDFTQLPGFLLNAKMSPNDKMMAFSWNGGEGTTFNIYLKGTENPTPVRFSDGSFDLAPEWSPEGDFIAYNSYNFSNSSSNLVIKSLVGNTTRTVSGIGGMNGSSPIDWANDNKFIVIAAVPLGKRRSVLHRILLEDLSQTQLTEVQGDTTSHLMPRLSPHNEQIVYLEINAQVNDLSPTLHNKNDLILMDLTNMTRKVLIKDLPLPSGLEWIDEHNLVYVNRVNGKSQLVNFNVNNGESTIIYSSAYFNLKGFGLFNTQRKVVIEAQRSDMNIDKVVLGDTTFESRSSLINFTSSDLSPTLNSKGQMAFISDYSGTEQLWMLEPGQTTPQQISYLEESVTMSNPEWSPDNNEIIFSTKRTDRNLRIERVKVDGTRREVLVEGKANYDNPSWSENGQSIYFYSDSLKTPQLFKMNLKTRVTEQVTYNEGLFGRETEVGFLFVKFGTAGIWKLGEDGGEERLIEDLTYFSLSDWKVAGNNLIYLKTDNNDPSLIYYDLKEKRIVRQISLPELKMPVPSLGTALDLEKNEFYITTSKELTSSLKTLEW